MCILYMLRLIYFLNKHLGPVIEMGFMVRHPLIKKCKYFFRYKIICLFKKYTWSVIFRPSDGILLDQVKGSMKSFRALRASLGALQRCSWHSESQVSCITLSTNRWRNWSMKRWSEVIEGAGDGLASGLLLQALLHFVSLINSHQ